MTPDDAFLQAILEAPDDDTPRLVYADYLEEQGDPRGEFIRVQIALARLPDDDPRREGLEARERQLLREHAVKWVRPIRSWVPDWTFRRGFVEAINLLAKNFLEHAADIFQKAPVRRVGLFLASGKTERLAACPYLERLDGLNLYRNHIGDQGLQELLSAPRLDRLQDSAWGAPASAPTACRHSSAGLPCWPG